MPSRLDQDRGCSEPKLGQDPFPKVTWEEFLVPPFCA